MNRILVIVDMQNDFIDGTLGTGEAKAIVPKVVSKIEGFEGEIAVTHDMHHNDYTETQEGKILPVSHCIIGTPGWESNIDVINALIKKETKGTHIEHVSKPTFGSCELGAVLQQKDKERHIDEVILVGLCTDICIISNALLIKAFLPETKITVDASCCAGVTPESHRNALKAMKQCQIFIENEEEI